MIQFFIKTKINTSNQLSPWCPKWIIGSMLGDTHIDNRGRLNVVHSLKQKDYFFSKFEKLKNLGVLNTKTMEQQNLLKTKIDKRTNKVYQSMSLWTLPVFKNERSYFYPNGIKIIPDNLIQFMTAESLAYWYMDDGGRNSRRKYGRGMVIDISCFNEDDRHNIVLIMKENFGLDVTFHFRSETNVKLYIKAAQSVKFCTLIRPYIMPSMVYKLTSPDV